MKRVVIGCVLFLLVLGIYLGACSSDSGSGDVNPGIVTDNRGNYDQGRSGDDAVPDAPDWRISSEGWNGEIETFGECGPPPYPFGCQCEQNKDCEGGFCVEGPQGFVCTYECIEECPTGWQCKGMTGFGGDLVFLCVPKSKKLCYPCDKDSQCGGGLCIPMSDGSYCTYECEEKNPCPSTFTCTESLVGEEPLSVCIPDSGSCECTPDSEGQLRPCTVTNDLGACVGYEKCDPTQGWVECTAGTPAEETCDGKDNDCDGAFDEGLPETQPCSNSDEQIGTCSGDSICMGPAGWVCTAPIPAEDVCDFKDNDCDDEVDEDFKSNGKYSHQNHCGTCNMDCTGSIAHATAECNSQLETPLCVVIECDPGYYKFNDFQCLLEGQTLCKPCVNDIQCEGGACASMAGGQHCTVSCTVEPCPDDFECTTIEGLDGKFCAPLNGTCDCGKDNAGNTRPCSVEGDFGKCYGSETCDPEVGWVDCTAKPSSAEECDGLDNDCNGIPDDGLPPVKPCEATEPGIGTCVGLEVCLGSQGWVCGAAKPELEKCDYKDNDCDGSADEDFLTEGKYSTLHHCGGCGKECEGILPNALSYCDSTLATPDCKVQECLDGFFKLNDYQCIVPPDVQCKVCDSDEDCYFDVCVEMDNKAFCLSPCGDQAPCAAGFTCKTMGAAGEVCFPDTGSCDCNKANAGAKRSCSKNNGFGTCFGFETCDPAIGWSACDALEASPEECDGIDNDCNGLKDDGLPATQPCTKDNQWGSCPGLEICMGNAGWVCQAPEPAPEQCDYVDNDCDGGLDEDFKSGQKYHLDNHCGTCNNKCLNAIANGTGKCDATYLVPKCVVNQCEDGYYQVSPFQCLIPPDTTCQVCEDDSDCMGFPCVTIDGKKRCAAPCKEAADCAGETSCLPYAGKGTLCQPVSGSCECNSFTNGSKRSCMKENEVGICYGFQTCASLKGWSVCDALSPATETCNGIDDDCNGLIDDDLAPTQQCSKSNVWGECDGQSVCMGLAGWICQAPQPAQDICDYQDNDCDGAADEDFKNAKGQYNNFKHCGSCTISCETGFPHATAKCDDTKASPQCVVAKCDEGYYKLNEFQCIPNVASLCEPCSTDDNCVLEGAKCIQLTDGKFCSKFCEVNGDCPSGYTCKTVGAVKQCYPNTNSCTCDGTNLQLSKSCSATWPANPGPGDPFVTCYGTQACTKNGWSPCALPSESCDAIDNDCNGTVDDGFLINGKYTTDAHCGKCGNNCTFLQYPNAKGVCDGTKPVPDCSMSCNGGYNDVNANPIDGCECQFVSATDLPDVDCVDPPACNPVKKDQNCDGVDGELGKAIFVAKNGSDSNAGMIDKPMLTIQAAIDKAKAAAKRDVYVATGVYTGSITLTAGIGVYGGYSSDFKQRHIVLYETVIMGAAFSAQKPGAVNALAITGVKGATVLDGFTVFGKNNNTSGGSSYAIYVKNGNEALKLTNNRIVAGNGGAGSPGTKGKDGEDGVGGTAGANASTTDYQCPGGKMKNGGPGGSKSCGGTDVSGGKGGDANCPVYGATPDLNENGATGKGNGGGPGGNSGWDGQLVSLIGCSSCNVPPNKKSFEGDDGYEGAAGTSGKKGIGCEKPVGYVDQGLWKAYGGSAGLDGGPGAGGGGGGAGGGSDASGGFCTQDHLGATGGGGGSGACSGTAGTPGGGAGGSFGLFLYFELEPATLPEVKANAVEGGIGGGGGHGGNGGTGGVGGGGASSGSGGSGGAWCGWAGGGGGDGGNGGHGGGGGGGCGGVSYCFYAYGQGAKNLATYKTDNTCLLGTGGLEGTGGPSIGETGDDGDPGIAAKANF
jgi:hypothetical protein